MNKFSLDETNSNKLNSIVDQVISMIDAFPDGMAESASIPPFLCDLIKKLIGILEKIKDVICLIPIPKLRELCRKLDDLIDKLKGIC